MNELKRLAQQAVVAVMVAIVGVVGIAPSLFSAQASAAGQVGTRSITMSTSALSATGATYTAVFTPATTTTNPDYIIDFCSNDPLVGDSCTATAGTDVPNFSSATAKVNGVTMTVATIGTNRGLKITGTSTYTSGTPITIAISNVTNPSTRGTFYARILVYGNTLASTHTSDSPGTYVDYGGIALSTVDNISITAKVFETLSFCVFTGSCGTAPTLKLGDSTTGALSSSNAFANADAQYTLATNAGTGVSVVMRGTTLCRSATPSDCNTGTASVNTITALASAATSSAGTEQFGMCVTNGTGVALHPQTPYDDSTSTCSAITTGTYTGIDTFAFNDGASTNGTNSTGGTKLLQSSGAVASADGTGNFVFMANDSVTTEAGLYTTSLNLVATSTF